MHCRCESFNSVLRTHNVYGNWAGPSRDIATTFPIQEQLRFICSGGVLSGADRLVSGHEMKNGHINILSSIQKHVNIYCSHTNMLLCAYASIQYLLIVYGVCKSLHFIIQHYRYAQLVTMNDCITQIAIYCFNANCSCRVNRFCKQPVFHWKKAGKHWKTFQAPSISIYQVTCHCRTMYKCMVQWCLTSSSL